MRHYAHLILAVAALATPMAVRAADEPGAAKAGAQNPPSADRFDIVRWTDPVPPSSFAVPEVKVSGRGLTDPDAQPLVPVDEKAIGAKVRPFKELDLLVGTEMSRSPESEHLRQEFNWQLAWSKRWDSLAGLKLDVSTTGSVNTQQSGVSETLAGSIGIPLFRDSGTWETQLRLSPRLTLDVASGTWKTAVTPEIVTEKALSSPAAPVKSTLSFKVGSGVSSDAPPSATAKVELKVSPKS